jgi:ParB/RepB/Spo0J family partition protein
MVAVIHTLPIGSLKANDYNPNRMTTDAFAELVAEVRHLGRLPKPLVVRPDGSGYVIVDGEHGWRAAKDVGLEEVPCEVIDADDSEAMRQTYKRNRHGNDDPVQLGRMFRRMMDAHGYTYRVLAKEIKVSEGTIRNALIYAEATVLRNSYARRDAASKDPETAKRQIANLTVREVRAYLQLPPIIANLWLDSGADLRELFGAGTGGDVDDLQAHFPQSAATCLAEYAELEQTGLVEHVRALVPSWGFVRAMDAVRRWATWERRYQLNGLRYSDLRPYTRHCFERAWPVRDECLMEPVLELLIDPNTRPPRFRLTAEEFDAAISESTSRRADTSEAFRERLRLQIQHKSGRLPDDRGTVRWQLQCAEINEAAPVYVRESRLPVPHRYALWKATLEHSWVNTLLDHEDEDTLRRRVEVAKQRLASLPQIPCGDRESIQDAIHRLIAEGVHHSQCGVSRCCERRSLGPRAALQ